MAKRRANVIAVFDDAGALERALHELDAAGLGDRVRHVDAQRRGAGAAPATRELHVVDQQGEMAHAGAPTGSVPDLDLSPFGEAAVFFEQAREEGGKLLTLTADDPERVVRLLEGAGAARVHAAR